MLAVILAGGENRRFPTNKCLAEVGGVPCVERIIAVLRPRFGRIVISTNAPGEFFRYGLPLVGDVLQQRGPMTGLLSVMAAWEDDWYFVVACDMPFIRAGLVGHLMACAADAEADADAVIPVFGGELQPLLGLYHRRLIPTLYDRMVAGDRGLRYLLSGIRVHAVDEPSVRERDPDGSSFVNINTVEDLRNIEGGT